MGIAKLIITLSGFCFVSACQADEHSFKSDSEETLFRNFTLAVCLGTAYEHDSQKLAGDVGKAASGYREFGHIGLEAYEDVRILIKTWLKKDYQSKQGGQIDIMKCIDLTHSNELQALFQKHDPCKNPEQWLDEDAYKLRCK